MNRPDVAAPILFWGIASGMVASLVCCFWPVIAAAGFFAVRGVRRDHDVSPGGSVGIGSLTGGIGGLLVATFGTAIVLGGSSPEQMAAIQAMGLGAEVPDLGLIAFLHAFIGFGVAVSFGLLGGVVAGSGPARRGRRPPQSLRPAPDVSPPPPEVSAPRPEVSRPAPDLTSPEADLSAEPRPEAGSPAVDEHELPTEPALDALPDLADEATAWSPPVQNAEEPADRFGADSEEEEDEGVDTV